MGRETCMGVALLIHTDMCEVSTYNVRQPCVSQKKHVFLRPVHYFKPRGIIPELATSMY